MNISNFYTEEHRQKVINANNDYVNDLKKAIEDNKIDEFFKESGFKPRFLDLIEVLLCFSDGEEIILNLYDYIISNIKDVHVAYLVQKMATNLNFHDLLIRDFDELFNRALNDNDILTNNVINFISGIIKVPGADLLILSKLNNIFDKICPTLVSYVIFLFKEKPYFSSFMKTNFENFIMISRGISINKLVKEMLNLDQKYAIKYIKNNFEILLQNAGGGNIFELLFIISNYEELAILIKEKIDSVVKYSNASDIIKIIHNLDQNLNLNLEKSNDILIQLREKITFDKNNHLVIGAIIKSKKNEYLKLIIENLLKQEEVSDYSCIGENSWSNLVFKIGSKVLKIGWIRNNPSCDDHYRVIKPELYEIIYDENNKPILYIEIQKFLSQTNIETKDIEDFYCDINNDGYIYIDPRGKCNSNFGILNENVFSENDDNISDSFRKKPLVLIDRDCLWKKNDTNINYMDRY
ncbi:MAG: hypothetical protein PHN42_01880 [Bacilli bacterium]|nr:hypothetical protein [Bacilli bacterium]